MKYYGKINYTIDKNHPDVKYVEDWTENKVLSFDDTYTFDDNYTEEDCINYIKRDLKLVADGGYNSEHIHNVTFEIERVYGRSKIIRASCERCCKNDKKRNF